MYKLHVTKIQSKEDNDHRDQKTKKLLEHMVNMEWLFHQIMQWST